MANFSYKFGLKEIRLKNKFIKRNKKIIKNKNKKKGLGNN